MKRFFATTAVVMSLSAPAMAGAGLQEALDAYASGRAAEAAAIYGDLARSGDGRAQFNLALMFYAGEGVPQSWSDAFAWAWRAKLNGVQQAEALLARVAAPITSGERTALAEVLTAELADKVAEGDARAMIQMSLIQSELLPRPDMVSTYVWQSLAVAMGMERAVPVRASTFESLSPRDQTKAQLALREKYAEWCAAAPVGSPACGLIIN